MTVANQYDRQYFLKGAINESEIPIAEFDTGVGVSTGFISSLEYMRLNILKYGTEAGSETLQISLSTSNANSASGLIAVSNVVNLADITTDQYWLGYIRFDFSIDYSFHNGSTYAHLLLANYTPSASFHISAAFDWPAPKQLADHRMNSGCELDFIGYR